MAGLVDFLVKMSKKEHSLAVRAIATILGAALFLAGIPAFVFWAGKFLPGEMILPVLSARILSVILFVAGIPWLAAAVFWQLVKGKGTPVPIVPTKHFLQSGPYRYARNPMIMGFFLYLLGWAFWWNKWPALIAAVIVEVLLYLEIKLVEEPELARRFGSAYLEYKKETPFMVPKLRRGA